jgi:pantetheine-phosphate adenylyltransferase
MPTTSFFALFWEKYLLLRKNLRMKIAVFPGSFDPFTIGHESIVLRATGLFDKIIIGIGTNAGKNPFFTAQQRLEMISSLFAENPKVEVLSYDDLTIDFCRRVGAQFMLRGLRTSSDFEYEKAIAQVNQVMLPEVESIFMLTLPEHASINSTVVREVLRYGGDVAQFLPKNIHIERYL